MFMATPRLLFAAGTAFLYASDNLLNDIPNTTFFGVNNGLSANVSLANQTAIVSKRTAFSHSSGFRDSNVAPGQFDASPNSPPAYGLIDPNLATPYVQQWNISRGA